MSAARRPRATPCQEPAPPGEPRQARLPGRGGQSCCCRPRRVGSSRGGRGRLGAVEVMARGDAEEVDEEEGALGERVQPRVDHHLHPQDTHTHAITTTTTTTITIASASPAYTRAPDAPSAPSQARARPAASLYAMRRSRVRAGQDRGTAAGMPAGARGRRAGCCAAAPAAWESGGGRGNGGKGCLAARAGPLSARAVRLGCPQPSRLL
jgi:hypothetical protein